MILQEFENHFARFSMLNRTVLVTSKVLLFIKAMDAQDRENVGHLLENEEGLITYWAMVKRVCIHFDKRKSGTKSVH